MGYHFGRRSRRRPSARRGEAHLVCATIYYNTVGGSLLGLAYFCNIERSSFSVSEYPAAILWMRFNYFLRYAHKAIHSPNEVWIQWPEYPILRNKNGDIILYVCIL